MILTSYIANSHKQDRIFGIALYFTAISSRVYVRGTPLIQALGNALKIVLVLLKFFLSGYYSDIDNIATHSGI
jgi:hypothetical protein